MSRIMGRLIIPDTITLSECERFIKAYDFDDCQIKSIDGRSYLVYPVMDVME